jgi:NAD-dependent DNA ligase
MKKLTNEFTGKNILFTGDMRLINEKWMYWLLCEMVDAVHKPGVSKKLDFVVIGAKAGPAKLKQVEELNSQGCNIQVIDEETFVRKYFELDDLPPYISFYY